MTNNRPKPIESPRLSWPAAIELFLDRWATDHPTLRPATLDHYREQLETRIAAFASQRHIALDRFTREDLRAFVAWLDQYQTPRGPISQRGKQMALNCAKMLLRWAHQQGLLAGDISRSVRGYRLDPVQAPRGARSDDLELLLFAFNPRTAMGVRNIAMVHLMAFCGLRASEICALNAGDLHPMEGQVTVRSDTGRGRRRRNVELASVIGGAPAATQSAIAEALTAWLGVRARALPRLEDDDPLFVTLERSRAADGVDRNSEGQRMTVEAIRLMLRRAAQRAGLHPRQVTARGLRHHFGLSATAAGMDQLALMEAMGHRSPVMTARYASADEIAAGIGGRRFGRPAWPTRGQLDHVLQTPGLSLSEIARRLFTRE